MNRIFRLIWNATFGRWQVAPEFAKSHGKPSSIVRVVHRSQVGHAGSLRGQACALLPFWRVKTLLCYLLAAQQVLVPAIASAQGIVIDGRTQTAVTTNGAVTSVTTSTIRGANAFNSFKIFNVGQGETANLHLPNGTANLINLVRDERTTISGILNSIKDGKIGGNVYFANPHGYLISSSGVVNVGSLTLATPTSAFVDNFFLSPGNPNNASVDALLNGTAPRNSEGAISVLGRINATEGISLSAGAINVGGTLYSGARFFGSAPNFTDVVNANGLSSASNVVVREGRIEIVADGDVGISGTIATPGASGVRGGDIAIRAGGSVDLQSGALVAARGNGENSAGGTVDIWADRDAFAREGALVDASAGASGDGGFIEFSAKRTVELAGGEFRADGMGGGKGGSVLIDPWNIVVSADILRGAGGYGTLPDGGSAAGANLTLLADNEITINENVTVSTRSVAGTTAADHATGASTGNSGNLTLEAGSIALKSGSKLLAGTEAGSGYAGGDVTLKATRNWTGEAKIGIDNATITGRNVALTANATCNDSILTSWLPVVVPVTVAVIDVSYGTIKASGTLTLGATSLIDVSSSGLSPLGMITAVSAAAVDVRGASVLTAGGNTTLAASSTVTSKATPGGPNPTTLPGDAGVATNVVVSTARTRVSDSSSVAVSGGSLDLTAKNAVTATTTADATAGGAVAIGGTLALSEVTSVTQAVIEGSATTSSTSLKVDAESTSVVTTSAKAANKGAKKQTEAEKTAAPSETEKTLDKYKDQTSTSDGSVDVAAAVAIANVNNITLAEITSTGTQTSAGAATVSSKASTASTVTADGSSASGTVGVGVAVGANIGVLVSQARVADNAGVSSAGLTVSAFMPMAGAKNSFVTTATSGAGASNVGVAGALGTNVLVNTTVASIEGDKDSSGSGAAVAANGGDVVVEAANTSESKVTVGASVKPASGTQPAAVGVGASVGMNVGVNTTVAEIGNGAGIGNAKDLGLTAKANHTLENAATGGAAGANVSVTPVAAITVAVNTTTARLGTGGQLDLFGAYASSAEQTSSSTTTATGQTQGDNVAVGASITLNSNTDTVTAEVDRNISAAGDIAIGTKSISKSSTSATASVAGGEKADADDKPTNPDGTAGKTADEKVEAQGDAAKASGKKAAEAAAANPPGAAGLAAAAASDDPDTKKAAEAAADKSPTSAGLAVAAATNDSKTKVEETKEAPKTEDNTESGGVSVAAAVAVNAGVATTVAKVAKGRTITSSGGALKVTSANETDTSAKADGSQVDSGKTNVGVGAAVALNAGISTNVAVVSDDAVVNTKGLTIRAVNVEGESSDSKAEAKSGAGAGDVGVAGSLAANVAINTTVAALEGDALIGGNGTGASVNAGTGDILIEAGNKTTAEVKSGADVKGTDDSAKVGVGASLGVNVGVNTTVGDVGDKAVLTGGKDFGLNATADHTLTTEVTGGAAGAKVAVTPLVAATIAVNTTTARLGESPTAIGISGEYSSTADHKGSATTTATGQTEGSSVAVGASIGLTVATDTVVAEIDRDVTATDGVEVNAKSVAKSSTTATASVAGGEKAKDDGSAPAPGGGAGSGKSVDEKVADQQTKATDAGKKTADKAPEAPTPAAGNSASNKLQENKDNQPPPKGETSEGGVSVAAAVGVNIGVATTVAKVAKGRTITSSGGALKVTSANETDTSAKADGSQVDSGKTNVGVGAAVALNVGVATTTAVVSDETVVSTQGLTIRATGTGDEKSDSSAEAKSGAGAGNVGVAGSLAINAAVNTTVALLEGDVDSDDIVADVNANGGAVLIEAQNATTSTAKVSADVKGTDDKAKVGVGASVGVNVAVNTTVAEVADKTKLANAASVGLNATANHAMTTEATGGAAGAKVSVTPVVAASIAVNTTVARLGEGTMPLDVSGAYSSKAEQTGTVTTKATGQAQGDVAVGASLGATIAVDNVHATVERNLTADGIELAAKSDTSLTTEVKAGAKGAKAAKKDADGNETPEAGTTVDEQKTTQLDFAKSRNSKAAGVNTTTPEAKTPDTTEQAPGTDKPTNPPNNEKQGKKVSVAAAIGATVAYNEAKAEIKAGKTVGAGSGKLKVAAESDTNYRTLATGEAVSDDVGVAAAVALTGTYNKTQATVGSGVTVDNAGDVEVSAISRQNRATDFQKTMSAEAVSGAGGGEVAVAGSLAVVGNWNETRATIDEGATIGADGAPVGDVVVSSDETSKVAAQARAGALSTGSKSKAGVGASFAVLLSYNQNTAAAGYDANRNGSYLPTLIWADSLSVTATKNRVWFLVPTLADAKNFVVNDIKNLNFDALDPSTYLGSNNYYTEAVAGAAAKGNAAVAGAFAVNVFGNTTEAYLGNSVNVAASGKQPAGEQLGVEIAAHSDTQAISFVGGVAGAKKAGVGLAATSIVNLDQTRATIGEDAVVKSNADGAGVSVSAYARQDIANVGVAGGLATEGAAVAGVLGAIVSLAKTEATIGEDAEVKSKGDVDVEATGDINAVMVAGGLAGGKNAGVGASIGANVLANQTRAEIGDNAEVTAKNNLKVAADADEVAVTAIVAASAAEKAAVSGAFSTNVIVGETVAVVGQGAQLNTDATYNGSAQNVAITAHDDTVVVGITGGGAGGGKAGVGAALDTTVLVKTVKAYIDDDEDGLNVAQVNADRNVQIDAGATETITSVSMGFAGGGNVGVGGAVSIVVNKNDVQAGIGKSAKVDSDGNVLVNAQDDVVAVLTAGAGAGGGDAGVGASLAVATLLGSSKAYVGDNAEVSARGNAPAATVYTGDTVITLQPDSPAMPGDLLGKKTESAKGLSVTAYNRENLVTTVVGGAGGGTAGVAATVSANVIANTTEASIGRGAKINENNAAASAEQQVRVKAIDETLLINTAGAGAGGSTAGVGAAANVGVVAKTTQAWIGRGALVNAKQAVELDAASSALTFSTTAGFAGGGSAGVGGAVAGVGVANTTMAYVEDGTSAADAAKINVSGGDLRLNASDLATSWLVTGAGAGGGAAGVGGSLSVGVNASTTKAKIGDYAETNASGTTEVHADSTENVNTITIAGAGGGSAGVAGSIGVNVVVSKTEAGIGDHAKVNQSLGGANQNVDVKATDRIITIGAAGAGAGGGAAGVGGSAVATVALNTTSAYIGNGAEVGATQDVKVAASSEKYANSAAVAGAGGGAAGVAGAVSVISVGSLLDGEAKSGLQTQDEGGNTVSTQSQADGQTTKSAVGGMLGTSAQSTETTAVLDSNAGKLAVSPHMADTATVPLKNTQAFVGYNATVKAGRDVTVAAKDTTLAINANGAGAGGGAAGVAGSLGVTLLHDSAEAFIANGAKVDADRTLSVKAETGETVANLGVTGYGGGAAGVGGSAAVNVVTSTTSAYIGDADINQDATTSTNRSVEVTADSNSNLIAVAGSGGGAGAAAVGGVLNVNTLAKSTKAFIGEGATVAADKDVIVVAQSAQNIVSAGISIQGAGAAAVGGAATVNVVANTTEAFIGSARDDDTKTAAVVDSDGNVVVAAADDTLVVAVAGSGTGAGAAAVGGAVGANVISSQTRAYVGDNSEINARGNAAGASVDSGTVGAAGALPPLPSGVSGDIDADRDGTNDGDVGNGASFTLAGGGASTGVNPSTVKDSQGADVGSATGGLGVRNKEEVTGLSVTASGNQKIISAAMGVAGAGAAGVTGTATADVIVSQTEARIGDDVQINQSGAAGTGNDVRVRAADNSLIVMTSGTIAGAGAAAVSGSANTAVIAKQTQAVIGDADVKARDVAVEAAGREDVYVVTVNASVAGAAGVGAAAGVGVIANQTQAGIKAGATVDAARDIKVKAKQDSALDIYTVSGAGGVVGVSGAFSVGVIDNTTHAYVEGGTSAATAATLDADGKVEISATSTEEITTGTVSAAGGGVGVAGAVGVKVVTSDTTAGIGNYTKVNQTRRGGATQDVQVSATDTVRLAGGGGSGAFGAYGAGATAEVNVVRNTTTASIGNHANVRADNDIGVAATSTKDVQSAAVAASGGASAGIAGAVALAFVGASIQSNSDAKSGIGDGATASAADDKMKTDGVGSKLGSSEHVQGTKSEIATRSTALGVSGELNDASPTSRDKTRAVVGSNAQLVAGGNVAVSATDRTQLDLRAVGAAGGAVGIGGAVGVGITHSTTEAFVDASSTIDADGDVTVAAHALNVNANGSKVESWAGAGGVVGLSASVAVLKDTGTTGSYLGNNVNVIDAAKLSLAATTDRKATTASYGASVGIAAIGASVAVASFKGATAATLGAGVQVDADAVEMSATDDSVASAHSRAGSAGIVAGSGSVATAEVSSTVTAEVGNSADIDATGDVDVLATSRASTQADAIGVNVGAGAVGASVATATSGAKVHAKVGENAGIAGASFDLVAKRAVKGGAPTAQAHALGAAGGLLLGANGSVATAGSSGETVAAVGIGSTITTAGMTAVKAENASLQSASSFGVTTGLLSLGANFSHASSDSLTQASLGDNVAVSGGGLQVSATGNDSNYSFAKAGAGGLLSVPYSAAYTNNTSRTYATTGSGDAMRKIDVGSFYLGATQTTSFNSWIDSTSASLVGVSGALARNTVNADTQALLGTAAHVEAGEVTMQAGNAINKDSPGANIPGAGYNTPGWNVVSSSGGLADVPAAESATTIVADALLQVGAGAHLEQNGPTGGIRLDAWNNLVVTDKVKMASGGAVSAASAKSSVMEDLAASGSTPAIVNRANASVVVAPAAELASKGDMALGARSQANLHAQAAVDVYGLVGVAPEGSSIARFKGTNTVDIGAAATLSSGGDVRLSAGSNTSDAQNELTAVARTDVFNNTAIPVNRDPVADAIIDAHSQINLKAGSRIDAAGDVMLYADEGQTSASGVGIGKDIYREALAAIASAISNAFGGGDVSFETRTGNSIRRVSSDVAINGEVHVGTNRQQQLVIGLDGTVTYRKGDIDIIATDFRDVAADIQARIQELDKLIAKYDVNTPDASVAVAAYRSERAFLQRKLKDLGFPDGQVATSPNPDFTPLKAAQDAVAGMTVTRNGYDTTRSGLEADNNTLTTQNGSLTTQNGSLTTQNGTLTTQNGTLTAQNVTLQAQIDALPPGHSDRITLQNQINANNATITANNNTITANNNTIASNNNTIIANENTIATNTTQINDLTTQISSLDTQIGIVNAGIANGEYPNTALSGPASKFLTVSDATARLGNIYLRGDRAHGAGTLDAPGDAAITIDNYGPNFLLFRNLEIPADVGGKIYMNGVDVNDNAGINHLNGAAGGAAFSITTADSTGAPTPAITIRSHYDPLSDTPPPGTPNVAPDLVFQGDISNPRGSVLIRSDAGSIRLEQKRDANGVLLDPVETASIRANDVEIITRNGDFVQSYTNTFFHTAGAPLTVTPGDPNLPDTNPARFSSIARTPEQSGKGIVANGSVLIAARYLNINGIIQSGIAEWGVHVPAGATVSIPGNATASFAQAMAYYNALSDADKAKPNAALFDVGNATVSGLSAPEQGKWEQIRVRYNAKEDRLELGGVQVQGGYIELFGQIFNTNMHESTGLADLAGGQLRVLDGYGKINVSNLTSKALWINTLDTGRGAKGEINISNIVGFDGQGRALVATTTYTRDPGDARSGTYYTPTTGLRYAAQIGRETGWTDNYRYSSGAIIGIETFPTQLDQYWISRVYSNNVAIPNNGEFLGMLGSAHSGEYARVNQTETTSSAPKQTASWFECNWWTLCAYGTYYKEFEITSLAKTITTDSLKADNQIAIKFIGFDNSAVNVSSTGDVVINGAIHNRSGDTTIASSGSILQGKDIAVVGGTNIDLTAGTGIGSTTAALQVNTGDAGQLDAVSASGDIRIRETLGDLRIGTVGGANVANLVLTADRHLVNADLNSFVQGRRVELESVNGGIGDIAGDPLTARTAYSADPMLWPAYGLKATARDSINIRNEADIANSATYSGNLLLISAESKAGDVRIETSGAVLDNNPFATTDTRTEAELAALWDDLRLRGPASVTKGNEAVEAYENGRSANYALYWKMRLSQPGGGVSYQPDYQLSAAERNALAQSGMSESEINQFEANRRTQYQQLHTEVGGLTSSYVAGYRYVASATESDQIKRGATWSDAQLVLSVGAGLLKNITDTVTTIKQPNAKGRNVTLLASTAIGSFDAPETIDLTAGLAALTTAQKAALAAAERGDASLDDPDNPTKIFILRPRPVNVEVGVGALDALATSGYALIGSEQDLRIVRVAAAGDVRIKGAGSLINGATMGGAVNVSGNRVILEAANGGIGSLPDADGKVDTPLRVDADDELIARAAQDIWIESPADLKLDTVYSRTDVRLNAQGSIIDAQASESSITPEINVRARNIDLNAVTGSIGAPTNSLDVGVNRDGNVSASAATGGQGVYLNGPTGEYFKIASVISGDALSLSSSTDMTIDGLVSGPGAFALSAGGKMLLTPKADVHATTLGVFLRAGSLEMQDAQRMLDDGETLDPKYVPGTDAAQIRVDAGTIDIETVGDAKITGIETGNGTESAIRVVSTTGRILDSGDTRLDIIADTPPAAQLTISAPLGVGANPLDVRLLNLQANSDAGVVDLAVQGSVNILDIAAGDRVWLTAGGDITGNAVTSGPMSGTDPSNPATGVTLATTGGSVTLASVSSTTGVGVAGQGGVNIGTVNVGTQLTLAGPQVSAVVNGGPGSVGGSVTGYAGGIADNVNLVLSGSGGFAFDSFWAATASVLLPLGPLSIENALIMDRATFQNPLTMLLVDQHNRSLQPADVQLYTAGAPFRLGLSGNHVSTDAFVVYRSPLHEVITPSGSNTSVVESGEDALARTAGAKREQEREETGDDDAQLISYAGIPVLLNEDCDPNRDEDCAK